MRAKATSRPDAARAKKCKSCQASSPAGQIVNGQCPSCAGLTPLPLRGEGGRFLPGLTPASARGLGSARGRRDRTAFLLLVVVPLAVLGERDGPMFPEGILPPRARMAGPAVLVLVLAVLVVAVGVVARLRRSTGHRGGLAVGGRW